jgi:hypothetical protein
LVMQSSERIVTQIPLAALWLDKGDLAATRGEYLDKSEIKLTLTQQLVQFIVADIGHKLIWIDPAKCYHFWKAEAYPHIVDYPERIYLERYPDGYAYLASRWTGKFTLPIIVLEKTH